MVRAAVGIRIRSERKALGLTQAELAKRADISPSYLNLIEADKRKLRGVLLGKIAKLLDVDPDALTGRSEQRMMADLREIVVEPLVQHINLSPELATDLVAHYPDWARVLLTYHRALRDQTAVSNALSDRLNEDPVLGNAIHQMLSHVTAIRSSAEILDETPEMEEAQQRRFQEIISVESVRMSQTAQTIAGLLDQSGDVFQAATPADEVDDFMLQHNAWFPELERVGDELRQKLGHYGGTDEVSLTAYLHGKHATTVVRLDSNDSITGDFRNLMKFDLETSQVSFLANAPRSTRRFQLGRQIALLEAGDAINAQLDDPLLTSDAARDRTRHALSSYLAGVLIFPYDEFHQLAAGFRYDIENLCQHYDASFEQVCHRLITLRNPNREGVPFAFLRSDPAGFITKRFPLPGLPLLRNGHACPLWSIFGASQTPNRTVRRLVEFPNRARYLMISQAVTKQPTSFHEAPFLQSIMLICDVLHATNTVYADGLDLSSELSATPVGPSCRMCSRSDCRFRNESQIVEAGSSRV